MIYIFHGDDQYSSREAHQQLLSGFKDKEIFRLDHKDFDFEKVNLFLNSPSLFQNNRLLVLYNPFSLVKSQLEKLVSSVAVSVDVDVVIWQDKKLRQNETAIFKNAKVNHFPLDKQLFSCLNSLKPRNHKQFIQNYLKTMKQEPFELAFFWFKNRLRQNLLTYSSFSKDKLKNTYLDLIKLDFQIKNGQLHEEKENALLNLLINLMS